MDNCSKTEIDKSCKFLSNINNNNNNNNNKKNNEIATKLNENKSVNNEQLMSQTMAQFFQQQFAIGSTLSPLANNHNESLMEAFNTLSK